MRRTLVISLFFIASLATFAQSLLMQPISVSLKGQTIPQALSEIERASGVRFSYNPDLISADNVEATFDEVALIKVLQEVVGTDIELKTRGSYVIILAKNPNELPRPQRFQLAGEIIDDATGEKIPYTTIYEVDKLTTSLSDLEGNYAISFATRRKIAYVAISKENYQDTIIRVDKKNPFPKLLKLKPLNKSKASQVEFKPVTDKSQIATWLVGDRTQKANRNVDMDETRFLQVSLVPGLGTNGTLNGAITNRFSLNIIAGYTGEITGLELGGFGHVVKGDVKGTQMAGFANIIGGSTNGAQIAGFINTNNGPITGLQLAGFINITPESTQGTQVAGFVNHSKDVKGLQMAGFLNLGKDTKGMQLAGFAGTGSKVKGAQVSGFFNASRKINGLQLAGFLNVSQGEVKGAQVAGFLNIADSVRGLQFGVINIARKIEKGAAVGIINIVKDGYIHGAISANDLMPINLSFLSGTNKFYSILSGGIKPGTNGIWSYGVGLGTQFHTKKNWFSAIELGTHYIQPLDENLEGLFLDNRLKVLLGFDINKRLAVTGGPVLHYFLTDQPKEVHPFLSDIGNNTFLNRQSGDHTHKLWMGYHIDFRF
ncbi:MAG: hypothetical protein KI790_05805 [Cyclobacteriaceae bacterium]|nr:hypothetical protein [Cyclobacteriaceae bacterium HetDA_MAG_MS6]